MENYFDTFTINVGAKRDAILDRALERGVNLRPLLGKIGISCDETTTPDVVERVWAAFGGRQRGHAADSRL